MILGPFNRVEGDLEVHLESDGGQVQEARVNSPLYRGFEQILLGKAPEEALVYTPRICGICSVSQSVACATALADLQGIRPTPNGQLATNLILANENVADHFTHFYLFFMPDFARELYHREPWYPAVESRFRAVQGQAAEGALEARAGFLHLMGLLAGKWPHSLGLRPGGTTRALEAQERLRVLAILGGFRRYLETWTFGDSLERIAALDSNAALARWAEEQAPASCDLRLFLQVAEALSLEDLGRGSGLLMSYGNYPVDGEPTFARGVWRDGVEPLNPGAITEDLSHSWMRNGSEPRHPFEGVTTPDADQVDGYSWCKAPRLGGEVVEVGAFARQVVDGQPLARDLAVQSGSNVRNRVIMRLLEVARVVIAMEQWARQIQPGEPFCQQGSLPDSGQGMGLVEAARGSLGHWMRVENGRISNYQIIAPTTWNFSPRDHNGVPGALEQALVGAPIRDGETSPIAVQHIVRSFDPCMVCTVH